MYINLMHPPLCQCMNLQTQLLVSHFDELKKLQKVLQGQIFVIRGNKTAAETKFDDRIQICEKNSERSENLGLSYKLV